MHTTAICFISALSVAMVVSNAEGFSVKIEFRNDITCYTCPEKKDNRECNRWAPDRVCPLNHTVCKTVHRINRHTGESMQVDKMCALPEQCSLDTVGCHDTDNADEIECVSCCTYSYCNIDVSYNLTTSLDLSVSVFSNSARTSHIYWPILTAFAASLFVNI